MEFDDHVNNYPNKEELAQYKRLQELSALVGFGDPGSQAKAMGSMEKEFGSVEAAMQLFEDLKTKIFNGWDPVD